MTFRSNVRGTLMRRCEFCSGHICTWESIRCEEVNGIFLVFIFAVQENASEDDFIFEICLVGIDVMET